MCPFPGKNTSEMGRNNYKSRTAFVYWALTVEKTL